MNVGKTLFAQIMEFVPWTSFSRIVARYGGDSGVRRLTCSEQFRVMAFAQLTWRESLRDIEVTLGANSSKLYAMGFRHSVHRSTLADANESRDVLGGSGWFGFVAPGGTPVAIVKRFNEEINNALKSPEVIERLSKAYAFAEGGTPEEFTKFLSEEGARWTKLVKDAGIKPE